MDEKYLWPLAGVLLGWVLTSISSGFRERWERKTRLGNLITKLLRIEAQTSRIVFSAEKLKDMTEDWSVYERIRKGLVERHFMQPPSVAEDLKKAIDEVAPYYPILGVELESLLEQSIQIRDADFSTSSHVAEVYLKMLSVHEVALDFQKIGLGKLISKLALKHGLFTWLKLRRLQYRLKRNLQKNSEFTRTWPDEILAEFKDAHNKSRL